MSLWENASKDFKDIVISFFAQQGLEISKDGTVVPDYYHQVQDLLHKAICHYLAENFIKQFKSEKFLSKINFSAKELVDGCALFLLAKHPDIPGILNLAKMSFVYEDTEKPGSNGHLIISAKTGKIKVHFNDFWSVKKGFNLKDDLKKKIEKLIMNEYDLIDEKIKKPKQVMLPIMD